MSTATVSMSSVVPMAFAVTSRLKGPHLGSKGDVSGQARWCKARRSYGCEGLSGGATATMYSSARAQRWRCGSALVVARARASEKASREARRGELGISTLSARKGQGTQQGGGALGLSVHGQGERKKMADAWAPPVRGAKGTFHASVSCRFPKADGSGM